MAWLSPVGERRCLPEWASNTREAWWIENALYLYAVDGLRTGGLVECMAGRQGRGKSPEGMTLPVVLSHANVRPIRDLVAQTGGSVTPHSRQPPPTFVSGYHASSIIEGGPRLVGGKPTRLIGLVSSRDGPSFGRRGPCDPRPSDCIASPSLDLPDHLDPCGPRRFGYQSPPCNPDLLSTLSGGEGVVPSHSIYARSTRSKPSPPGWNRTTVIAHGNRLFQSSGAGVSGAGGRFATVPVPLTSYLRTMIRK